IVIAAGVVFLGPSLVGYYGFNDYFGDYRVNATNTRVPAVNTNVYRTTVLYPSNFSNYSVYEIENPHYALYDDNNNAATFRFGNMTQNCPSSSWAFIRRSFFYCRFNNSLDMTTWLKTTSRFRTLAGRELVNPTNVTSVEVKISCPSGSSCSGSAPQLQVYVSRKCMTRSSNYEWAYLANCRIQSGTTRICTMNLGANSCPGGFWQVNGIVVGLEFVQNTNSLNVNWIRIKQRN
ncbi:MAG: hypothetical protein V1644_02700, partial [Candidatus Micrarchaeota archaeon]